MAYDFNRRSFRGIARECPQAQGCLRVGKLAAWRQIRDGLANLIICLPVGERRAVRLLQDVWSIACDHVEEEEALAPKEVELFP